MKLAGDSGAIYDRNIKIGVVGEPPNMDLYRFEGSFDINGRKIGAGAKQLLLRGAFLRNTEWIIGVTVYSGLDTKIMRNAEASRVKQSFMEATMN
jgi:phospholipid-transporting ATPase